MSTTMQVRGVDFILISSGDMERSLAFYGDILGLEQTEGFSASWVEFDAGGSTIAVGVPPPEAPQPPFRANGVTFALAVPDARAAIEAVRARGVAVLQEVTETPVCFMGLIADPDGNMIFLHQRKDGSAGA
jgi:predicted enzyme related to lactoylglutathione lyase